MLSPGPRLGSESADYIPFGLVWNPIRFQSDWAHSVEAHTTEARNPLHPPDSRADCQIAAERPPSVEGCPTSQPAPTRAAFNRLRASPRSVPVFLSDRFRD